MWLRHRCLLTGQALLLHRDAAPSALSIRAEERRHDAKRRFSRTGLYQTFAMMQSAHITPHDADCKLNAAWMRSTTYQNAMKNARIELARVLHQVIFSIMADNMELLSDIRMMSLSGK